MTEPVIPLCVLAGTAAEFAAWLPENGVTAAEAVYGVDEARVRSFDRYSHVYTVGTFWQRSDAPRLYALAAERTEETKLRITDGGGNISLLSGEPLSLEDKAEAAAAASRTAQSSLTLARAVLGDAALLAIVEKYAGKPNSAATRRQIIDEISTALRAKMQSVAQPPFASVAKP